MSTPILCFFFKFVLAILGSCHFHINFGIILSIFATKLDWMLIGIESADRFGDISHLFRFSLISFHNVLYFKVYKCYTSFFKFMLEIFYYFWYDSKWNYFLQVMFRMLFSRVQKCDLFLYGDLIDSNLFMSSNSFLVIFLGFSVYKMISSTKRNCFTFSFSMWYHLFIFLD